METTLLIAIALILVAGIAVLYRAIEAGKRTSADDKSLIMLQNQINEITRTLDTRLGESNKEMRETIHRQLSESGKIISEVTEKLTRLDETNKQVLNFSDQLKNLQDILKNPKQRGVLGEYYLETLLKNVLPPESYQMQYGFEDGTIVDAIVRVKDRIIPIDSKFSLENYNRISETSEKTERERLEKAFLNDLKGRIVETAKYIKPREGTMDFAFMFIPHEAIYYDLLVNKIGTVEKNEQNLVQRAAGKYHVIIVSPTSFLAYLQTVLQGLQALKIEEQAQEIKKGVQNLNRHLASYSSYLEKLGKHLGTTVSMYNQAHHEFRKIDKDVLRISGENTGVEKKELEKPRSAVGE